MNGEAVVERSRASRPKISVIFMSGDTVDIVRSKACGGNGALLLPRQIIADQLLRRVREVPDA
ncbi:MAG: response regulator [Nitrospirae bacterium]|nr:response regulator [Nitrospirota bacterium]